MVQVLGATRDLKYYLGARESLHVAHLVYAIHGHIEFQSGLTERLNRLFPQLKRFSPYRTCSRLQKCALAKFLPAK